MTLRPEQERALAYVRRRGTEAPLAEIVVRVEETYRAIETLAEGTAEHLARRRPAAGGWSVAEVVDHLVESDRLAARQLAELLAGRSSEEVIPAGLQSTDPLAVPWPGLLSRFRAVHGEILSLLAAASDSVPQVATAPVEMVVKCTGEDGRAETVSWLARLDWKAYAILLHAHNREHIAQLERILRSLEGGTQPWT